MPTDNNESNSRSEWRPREERDARRTRRAKPRTFEGEIPPPEPTSVYRSREDSKPKKVEEDAGFSEYVSKGVDKAKEVGSGILSSVKDAAGGVADWLGFGEDAPEKKPPPSPPTPKEGALSVQTASVPAELPVRSRELPPTEEKPGKLSKEDEEFLEKNAQRQKEDTAWWAKQRNAINVQKLKKENDEDLKKGYKTKKEWEEKNKQIEQDFAFSDSAMKQAKIREGEWAKTAEDLRKELTFLRREKKFGTKKPPKEPVGRSTETLRKLANAEGVLRTEKLNKELQDEIY